VSFGVRRDTHQSRTRNVIARRRAINIHEGNEVDGSAFKALVRQAVASTVPASRNLRRRKRSPEGFQGGARRDGQYGAVVANCVGEAPGIRPTAIFLPRGRYAAPSDTLINPNSAGDLLTSKTSVPNTETDELGFLRGRTLAASLTVNDLEASLSWYRDILGFGVYQKFEREGKLIAVSLRAGDVRILIGQDDGARGADRRKGEGFSLQIETDQNVDEVANRVKQSGGTLESEPITTPWGARMFRMRDPDGFKFTVSSLRTDWH
jgi:uncharacterized glyoxalase superfamily protein PhnB